MPVPTLTRVPPAESGQPRDPARAPAGAGSTRRWWFAGLALLIVWSFHSALSRPELTNPAGFGLVRKFFAAAAHPTTDAAFLRIVADSALTTASYALAGTALSLVIGLVGGLAVSETWWSADPIRRSRWPVVGLLVSRGLAALPRGTHEAVWGLILLRVLGLDPWVAVLAIAIPYGAITAKVVAESIDDEGGVAYRSYRAAGAGRLASTCYGIAPTVLPEIVSYGLYRLECSVRASTVLGMIGAGGLGYQIAVSLQSLRYEEIWTLLAALAALSALADWWSARLRRSPGRVMVIGSAIVASLGAAAAVVHLGLQPSRLLEDDPWRRLASLGGQAWPPTLPRGGWETLGAAIVDTVSLSVVAITVAGVFAVPLAFLAARPAPTKRSSAARRISGATARCFLLFLRCVPPPVWALLVLFVVYPGPLAGGLGLAIYTLGVLARLQAEAIEHADRQVHEQLVTSGARPAAAALYGLVPIVTPRLASLGLYRWEVAARETVIVGLVGAGGLGRLLAQQNAAFDESAMLTTVLALVVVSLAIDLLSGRVRAALR